jgi:hypothetical protein
MSETGGAYGGSDKGEEYGPRYGGGDTVGAGLHLGRQEIFFTWVDLSMCIYYVSPDTD